MEPSQCPIQSVCEYLCDTCIWLSTLSLKTYSHEIARNRPAAFTSFAVLDLIRNDEFHGTLRDLFLRAKTHGMKTPLTGEKDFEEMIVNVREVAANNTEQVRHL